MSRQRTEGKAATTLPAWITDELIAETLEVWQPYYADRLTEQDAIGILLGVGRLFDQLGSDNVETIPGVGEGVQP